MRKNECLVCQDCGCSKFTQNCVYRDIVEVTLSGEVVFKEQDDVVQCEEVLTCDDCGMTLYTKELITLEDWKAKKMLETTYIK